MKRHHVDQEPTLRSHTETLRGTSIVVRKPLATPGEVEDKLTVLGHELLATLKIPTGVKRKLGQLVIIDYETFFVFRSPEPAPDLANSSPYMLDARIDYNQPAGTVEIIRESDLEKLAALKEKPAVLNTLGNIVRPEQEFILGRANLPFGTEGQFASNQHVVIGVTPDEVRITDISKNGTTVTFVA